MLEVIHWHHMAYASQCALNAQAYNVHCAIRTGEMPTIKLQYTDFIAHTFMHSG